MDTWTIQKIWNDSLEAGRPERILSPREHIWASEIGGSMIDRYLKMKAEPPTNPPNPRSQRKFEAGNIWESIIGYVLKRAGILLDSQEWVEHTYPGLLKVTGKLDFVAGGKPDYEKASCEIQKEFSWLPEFVTRATVNIVNGLKEKYPNGLKEIVLEIKSCSAFMYEVYEKKGQASVQHQCQNFHYLKSKKFHEGHVVYISKDDARILELPIYNPSTVEDLYLSDIEKMTGHIKNNYIPHLEKPIVYDDALGKFSANWKVGYSQYLTKLYGLKDQKEFDDKYKPTVERWNRVMGRIEEGNEMTKNNLEAIKEMKDAGFEIEKLKETPNDAPKA